MTAIGTSAAERPAFKACEFVVRAVLAIGWTGWGIICANVPGAGSIAPALAVLSYALSAYGLSADRDWSEQFND